jgi:UDP-3-O-[3-hydroxymyristoyl] N-acetylglucosamine deacetylase
MGRRANGANGGGRLPSRRGSARDFLFRQQTIRRSTAISGVGIHTGKETNLRILPAPVGSGIRFRRTDARSVEVRADIKDVSSLELATTLGRDDVTVSTVEHLLAAVYALGIDNLVVELDGPEVPILDGSALPYVLLLQAAGIRRQNADRRILAMTSVLEFKRGDKWLRASPYPGLRLDYTIDFPGCAVGRQRLQLEVDQRSFERDLAPARTFCRQVDVEQMQRAGLGLGGSVDNCIVFDEKGAVNTDLRFADEPVRHKALDAVGDFTLLGAPIWGYFEIVRGGHQLHYELMKELVANPQCWTWVIGEELPPQADLPLDPQQPTAWTPLLAGSPQ